MLKYLAVLILGAAAHAAWAMDNGFHLHIAAEQAFNDDQHFEIRDAAIKIERLLSEWSFTRNLPGDWQVIFAQTDSVKSQVVGLEDEVTDFAAPNEHGELCFYVLWDRIFQRSEAPVISTLERIAIHIYKMTVLGTPTAKDSRLNNGLSARAAAEVLQAIYLSPSYNILTLAERAALEDEMRHATLASHERLTPEEARQLDCNLTLRSPTVTTH